MGEVRCPCESLQASKPPINRSSRLPTIANYQCVVPSTWNAGPRDGASRRGPYEEALIGTPVADPERPIEILRTIHSFDPCMACGVHVVDPRKREFARVRVT